MKRRGKYLLRLARTRIGGWVLRAWLRYAPQAVPLPALYRSRSLLAFRHPSPSYPFHLLLVPLPPDAGLQDLTQAHAGRLAEVLNTARHLVDEMEPLAGWQLVVNGGEYQDVALLHFHLIAGEAVRE